MNKNLFGNQKFFPNREEDVIKNPPLDGTQRGKINYHLMQF